MSYLPKNDNWQAVRVFEQGAHLDLDTCPHCGVNTPNLSILHRPETKDFNERTLFWAIYGCRRCGGVVVTRSLTKLGSVVDHFPKLKTVSADVPSPARERLESAIATKHQPMACVMVCASAIDEMLKAKQLVNGPLYSRIEQAATNGIITEDMKAWAHDVRLDANDQRHADVNAGLPTEDDADRCIEFALTLAEILFVLPARVKRGLAKP